jgi:hypothetical protein
VILAYAICEIIVRKAKAAFKQFAQRFAGPLASNEEAAR